MLRQPQTLHHPSPVSRGYLVASLNSHGHGLQRGFDIGCDCLIHTVHHG